MAPDEPEDDWLEKLLNYKPHKREYIREWLKKNKDKKRKYSKDYYDKTFKNNPERLRRKTLKTRFGITLEIYNKMLVDQNNKCKLCDKEKKLVVDHCHSTGKVRGLLCNDCNSKLGWYEKRSSKIKDYLE